MRYTFIIFICISFFLFNQLNAQDTIRVTTNLFGQYNELPILGGNLKPSIQPHWNQTDFLEHLSALQPQTLRWPGAEAANYFDWNKGTLMPCYKWSEASHPYDHIDNNLCGYQWDQWGSCNNLYPRTIQTDLMNGTMRSVNYVDNYASNYMNALKTLRGNIDNKPLIPFFTLNVLSPEYYNPDSVEFDSNCEIINTEPVNTISQQLDSIAILTSGMGEIYIQLGNEPWYAKPYKETIWPNASAYFLNMITIADSIASHPGLQHAKVSLFADVHSDDIEDDDCINNNTSLRCAWNDSMHTILSTESAHNLFDAYSIHKYTGFKNIQIPELDVNCNPIEADWIDYLIEEIPNFNDCQMNYVIKWMIITRDQMFENFAGNDQYPGLYNSINGNSSPKDIWITEYDMGLDDNDAFDKPYSNGWPHALYNLYTTLKYMTEVPNIDVLIQNNIVGYSGGYRLIDTYSYVDGSGTNNAFENIDGNLRPLVSHTFIGLSPKGELMRLLNELAWRNSKVAQIMFDPSKVDSTEIRGYQSTDSYYAKDIYGWAFDAGDFLFMNVSNDTLSVMIDTSILCKAYDYTLIEGDFHARNYQTSFDHGLAYEMHPSNQVIQWEFDSDISVPSNVEQDHFAASYKMHISTGSVKDFHPTFNIPAHSVIQILKDNTFNENACDCAGNVLDGCGICGGSGIIEGKCDCAGNVLDECEVCGGDGVDADNDGVCDDVDDCVVEDGASQECGCNTGIVEGVCDCDGNVLDECEVCGGDGVDFDDDRACDDIDDCVSTGAEHLVYDVDGNEVDPFLGGYDECGICGGDGLAEGFDCDGNQLSLFNGLIPEDFSIHSIYPNPFNPVTNIIYGLPEHVNVQIMVFDLSGKQVETLINEFQTPGYHSVNWNADNLPSGIYLIRMDSGDFTQTQKVVLIK